MKQDMELLERICRVELDGRREAIAGELSSRGLKPVILEEGTIVLPSQVASPISLVAHYDNVAGSRGYNDNGMGVVAILGMLGTLPLNVEAVFTNGEERGSTGAMAYLEGRKPSYCVNLDVCGCGDRLYLDPMNCTRTGGVEAVRGRMPWNDGRVFQRQGIETVCLAASRGDDFEKGISYIWTTIHNHSLDNRLDLIDFGMLGKVREAVASLVGEMSR